MKQITHKFKRKIDYFAIFSIAIGFIGGIILICFLEQEIIGLIIALMSVFTINIHLYKYITSKPICSKCGLDKYDTIHIHKTYDHPKLKKGTKFENCEFYIV
jgi:hypothetical protein